jgi:hypothetical protein
VRIFSLRSPVPTMLRRSAPMAACCFSQLDLIEPRTQHAHGLGAILDLRFFVLAGNDQAGRQVRNAHRGVSGIDRLAAGAGRTERIDADVFFFDLDFDFVGFGQHGDGDGGGVDAPLLLGGRHALHAMHAALVLQRL